jgi:hypothetical protein
MHCIFFNLFYCSNTVNVFLNKEMFIVYGFMVLRVLTYQWLVPINFNI